MSILQILSISKLQEKTTQSATVTQNYHETTFIPDYDVEGSVVVGEIIGVESIDEISGDGNFFKKPTIDILPRIDFLKLIIYKTIG